jgi:hypothetical protein
VQLTDEQVRDQWQQVADTAAVFAERAGSAAGFASRAGSPLAGDDAASAPYQVSHVVQFMLTSAVDHLHGLCALVLKTGWLHIAAPASLARGVLESASTTIWILSPSGRDERIRRSMRWAVQEMKSNISRFSR